MLKRKIRIEFYISPTRRLFQRQYRLLDSLYIDVLEMMVSNSVSEE